MTNATTEHNLFRPLPKRAVAKADITTQAARAIIDAEAEHRSAKTARLREARLAVAVSALLAAPESRSPAAPAKRKKPKL